MKRIISGLAILLSLVLGGLAAIYFLIPKTNPEKGELKVAATIFPLYDLVRQIGGDRVETVLILPPLASPHIFDPTPSKIREIYGSRLIFKIGGVDDWADSLAEISGERTIVTVDRNVKFLEVAPGVKNFHYWLDPTNGKIIAENIFEELAGISPENRDYFSDNLGRLEEKISAADETSAGWLSGLPNKKLIVFHNAWEYFTEHYGLSVVGVFEPNPGQEPTPRLIADLVELAKEEKIKTIFSEPQFSSEILSSLAEEAGLKIAVLDPLGGETDRMSYPDLILYNSRTILENLR